MESHDPFRINFGDFDQTCCGAEPGPRLVIGLALVQDLVQNQAGFSFEPGAALGPAPRSRTWRRADWAGRGGPAAGHLLAGCLVAMWCICWRAGSHSDSLVAGMPSGCLAKLLLLVASWLTGRLRLADFGCLWLWLWLFWLASFS